MILHCGKTIRWRVSVSWGLRCRWQTRATQWLTSTVLYTDVDG